SDIRVDDLDRSQGIYYVNLAEGAENPDDEPGFFSRLFGGGADKEEIEARAERYQVRLGEADGTVRVTLVEDVDTPAPADVARRVLNLLKDHLGRPALAASPTQQAKPVVSPDSFLMRHHRVRLDGRLQREPHMSTSNTLGLKKIYSGKVRDLYEIDDKRMLMVATERPSAFDVILAEPIPGEREHLT